MRTLYISDLDGTLLNGQAELSEYTAASLTRLIQSGAAVTFATARTTETAFEILQGVPFCLPAVLMNGVVIYDMATGACLHQNPIPLKTVREIKAILKEYGVSGFTYRLVETGLMTYYETLDSPVKREFVESRKEKYGKPFTQVPDFELLPAESTVYFCLLEDKAKLDPVAEALRGRTDIGYSYYRDVYHPGMWFLELYSAAASKYHAVCWLRDFLKPEEIVGFGDNLNDLPLFDACDRKYAVENAAEDLKQKADGVIGSNIDDGVARFLEREFR